MKPHFTFYLQKDTTLKMSKSKIEVYRISPRRGSLYFSNNR